MSEPLLAILLITALCAFLPLLFLERTPAPRPPEPEPGYRNNAPLA